MRGGGRAPLALLRAAIEAHGGVLFKIVGDAVQAAFPTAPDAVAAALDAQRALLHGGVAGGSGRCGCAWRCTPAPPNHAMATTSRPGLNRLARLLAAGAWRPGAALRWPPRSSPATPCRQVPSLRDLGEHPLRDLYRPERVFQLLHPDLPADFPPLRTLATRPNNLPLQPTPFLGREEQVAQVVALLRP